MANKIYTIGREFGSGGREVGEKLAAKLGIKLYDKELLQQAAKDSGFCEEIFENHDEKPTNSFLYSLVMDTYSVSGYSAAPFLDMPLNHKVFLAQFETIKKIAEKESCVIVGRCADYILERAELDHISLFIAAPFEWRVQRKMEQLSIDEKAATSMVRKKDKDRKAYYDYYTGRSWGRPHNYDLCINSSRLGIEVTAEKLAEMVLQLEKGTSSVDFDL